MWKDSGRMMTDVGKMQARRITRDEKGKGCLGKDNRGISGGVR